MTGPELHLYVPQIALSIDAMVERAQAAEVSGFDGLALMDHLVAPMAETADLWEAMTLAGWLLARTSTLTVGHLVLCDAFRHPAVLARQAVTLDHASGGRFELGLGWGSIPAELVTFGVGDPEARARVDRLTETLQVLEALWTGEPVTFDGSQLQLRDAQQRPTPSGRIPIVIGGTGRRTMELVARHAAWWNVQVDKLDQLDERRPLAGEARVSVQLMVAYVDDEADRADITRRATRRFGALQDSLIVGNGAEVLDRLRSLSAQGVERAYVWFTDQAAPSTIAAFGRDVIGPLRA